MIHDLPDWWAWDLELTPHLLKRMENRGFDEGELRTILEQATTLTPKGNGRFVVVGKLQREAWEVILEPDEFDRTILVITAYRIR